MSSNKPPSAAADSTAGKVFASHDATLGEELKAIRTDMEQLAMQIESMTQTFATMDTKVRNLYKGWGVMRIRFQNAQLQYDRLHPDRP